MNLTSLISTSSEKDKGEFECLVKERELIVDSAFDKSIELIENPLEKSDISL